MQDLVNISRHKSSRAMYHLMQSNGSGLGSLCFFSQFPYLQHEGDNFQPVDRILVRREKEPAGYGLCVSHTGAVRSQASQEYA